MPKASFCLFAVLRTAKPGNRDAVLCALPASSGLEPCYSIFGSSLNGEGAVIPLLLDQLVPSFARYDLPVPITGPRFFLAGFEDEEPSFAHLDPAFITAREWYQSVPIQAHAASSCQKAA